MSSIEEEIRKADSDIVTLKKQINQERTTKGDATLPDVSTQVKTAPKVVLRTERTLKGHLSKVYAVDWARDSKHVVSVSQDGKMIVWNAFTTYKVAAIPLRTHWVMTCAYGLNGELVCSGGLDNVLAVYNIATKENPTKPTRELTGHGGYISCARFVTDGTVLTASGDMTNILWDLETATPKVHFQDHTGDVMSLSVSPDGNTFVSGGCDAMSKVWDIRSGQCVASFFGHQSDINCVKFFPNGNLFATGSDDASCKIIDLRANRELNTYTDDTIREAVTSLDFSKSGRFCFVSYDTSKVLVWDTLKGVVVNSLEGHEARVSCVAVSDDGMALATASWDSSIKIWA